jgi:fatty-acyl-CoA synthase
MMDYPLTLSALLRRAETYYADSEIVSRLIDKRLVRYTYGDWARRTRQLALALSRLGIRPGDRVATLCWNHYRHLEAYFGIPVMGGVLHTLNLRLHADDLAYIVNHADDQALLVDESLWPLFASFRDRVRIRHVIVLGEGGPRIPDTLDYEELIAAEDPNRFDFPDPDERQAAAMCYTSGTTGRPKGVVYSHRSTVLHSLVANLPDSLGLSLRDAVCPVVPMFHANAWGMPFSAVLVGAKLVFPGRHLDPTSLLDLFAGERVTVTAGVPTIWLGVLQLLDKNPGAWDLSALRCLLVGGAAAPLAMIQGFQERHGLTVVQGWGMTETSPLGSLAVLSRDLLDAPPEVQYTYRAKQGRPVPFVEVRARGEEGLVPWDGRTMGELEVRGPWVAKAYYNAPEAQDRFTADGWFRTGDIVTLDSRGYIELQDRAKDLVKSGGEWISSVALENALMGHPKVAEAAVIAVPHPKWQERPLAVVVLKEGEQATEEELLAFLAPKFAKWWLPDAIRFVDEIPKTSAGKFLKSALREQFRDVVLPEKQVGSA